jgi:PAS domain S-box-containing protein
VWERGRRVEAVGSGTELVEGFITDVTDQYETARELWREREFVDQALDTLDDLFYVVGADGRMIRWNERLMEVTGYTNEEIAGMYAFDFFPEDERERIGEAIDETLTAGKTIVEADILTADGERVPYEFTGRRLTAAETDMAGLVGVGRDVQERERRQRDLEQKNERLDEFTGIISHDLRSPLSVASGRIDLAKEECDSEHLAHATSALERSQALIDDLLILAQEGDRDAVESVALSDVIEACWRTVETEDATLVVDVDRRIRADRSRLQQALANLVRNAVEHGEEDVTVTFGEMEDGFYVADDGRGIPEEERERVFEPGYSTAADGTGFGLSIVEQIIEQHGCEIRVAESDAGGARFEITGVEFVD